MPADPPAPARGSAGVTPGSPPDPGNRPGRSAVSRARLFVAATPPVEVTEVLIAAVSRARPSAPTLRWVVDPQRIHLTLVFLGSVDDALRQDLADRLGHVARHHPPVAVRLAGVGRFGDRVLWAGVAGALAPLAAGVRRAAGKAGVAGLDDRPLRAHLTLARVPAGRNLSGTGTGAVASGVDPGPVLAAQAALGELPALAWTVDRFELVRSVLGPHPRYVVESAWPLSGS